MAFLTTRVYVDNDGTAETYLPFFYEPTSTMISINIEISLWRTLANPHSKMTSQGYLTDLLAGYRDVHRTSCSNPV